MKGMRARIIRVVIGACLLAAGLILGQYGWSLYIFLAGYAISGYDVLWKSARNIAKGQVFDENFLMSIATIGAFVIGEYAEGVGVMVFYQVGEIFQKYAVNRSRSSVAELMDIRPDYANLERDGAYERVDPYEVTVGDIIRVSPGEKIPLDGVVVSGEGWLDTAALTGESVPRAFAPGDEVLSGCIDKDGLMRIQVTKEFGESTVSKILELVENAQSKKSKTERFITRFARYYTPAVVICALLLAVLPPLLVPGQQFADWGYRALSFLVISCPCALVISIPMGFFGGIGGAAKQGILIKGGSCMEILKDMDTAVFDKTGTLTDGKLKVREIYAEDQQALLELAAYAESISNHPIARSVVAAYGDIDQSRIGDAREVSGKGVIAMVDGHEVKVGSASFIGCQGAEGNVHVARDGVYIGSLEASDGIKPEAREAIAQLKKYCTTVMLTGDTQKRGQAVAEKIGMDDMRAELMPGDKVAAVESLIEKSKGKVAFVGDGINDAPVLARSDVGIAMGALGSDAAIEAADVVIMDDDLRRIPLAVNISRRTMKIVKENIVIALAVKGAVLLLSAIGISNMWEAVFADVGVAIIAILNAMRAGRVKEKKLPEARGGGQTLADRV